MACKRLEQTSPSVRLRGDKKSDKNKNDKVCKAFLKSSKQLITHKGSVTRLRECLYHGEKAFSHDGYACNPSQHSGNLKPTLSQVERKTKQHPVDTLFPRLCNEAEMSHAPKEEHGVPCSQL